MDIRMRILKAVLLTLFGYGLFLVVLSFILKVMGRPIKKIWTRYLTWFIIIPPFLLPLLYSKYLFQAIFLFLSILLFREYANVVGLWKDRGYVTVCYIEIVFCYFPIFLNRFGFFQVIPIYLIVLVLLVPIIRGEYKHMIQKSCLAMLGVTYFGWFLSHVAFMRNIDGGIGYIFYLFILVISNDAGSYLSGKIFGRTPLVPKISPKKTNEGFVGGIILVIFFSFLFASFTPEFTIFHRIMLALVISVGGTCGDLVMSFIKRDLGLKDFGRVLPGHGGLLDRFDSLIFVSPLFFHLVNLLYSFVE